MRYEPPLDGVRAVAILAVIAYHGFPSRFPGGFAGVDVFFVLSGYLITSVILSELREGRFSLKEFYLRRVQRLLPNAVAVIAASIALSLLVVGPMHAATTARHALWTLFNLSNVYIRNTLGGYWGESGEYSLLLHTWSLAVEEQFYLLFPAALLAAVRRWPSRVDGVLSLCAAASLAVAVVLTGADPDAAFYLLPARAWQLLLGAILAARRFPAERGEASRPLASGRATEVAGWAGLVGVAASFVLVDGTFPLPGLTATLGSALVLVSVADGGSMVTRLLSTPFLTLVGRLSYSIYLWHWPGLVLGRLVAEVEGVPRREAELVGMTVGIVLAALAYRLVEQPMRRRGAGRGCRLAVLAAGFSACAAASAALSLSGPGLERRDLFDQPSFTGLLYDVTGVVSRGDLQAEPAFSDMKVPPRMPGPAEPWRTGGIVHGWGEGPPRVVVVGSSHANMYGSVVDSVCRQLRLPVAFYGADGGSPVFGSVSLRLRFRLPASASEFEAVRARWLEEWKPDLVIVVDKWDNHEVDGFGERLEAFVKGLERATRHVLLVSQPPVLRIGALWSPRAYVSRHFDTRGRLPRIPPDDREAVRRDTARDMEALAARRPEVRVLRADESFTLADGTVRYLQGRAFLYADRDHLSDEGARTLRDRFVEAISWGCGLSGPSASASVLEPAP